MSKLYLVAYNSLQTVGWSYLLYQTCCHLAAGKSVSSLYESTSLTLQIFQTAALLEILHAMLGLVRSSVQVTVQQVWSRSVNTMVECGRHRVLIFSPTPGSTSPGSSSTSYRLLRLPLASRCCCSPGPSPRSSDTPCTPSTWSPAPPTSSPGSGTARPAVTSN